MFPIDHTLQAATQSDADAVASAPDGIDITNYFSPVQQPLPIGEHNPFKYNSATIKKNYILDLANGVSTTGALWGDPDKKNYLDLRYPQTISAWLYFGPNDDNTDAYNGQGMALVLQNDSRNAQAMGAGQQALGVDGYDRSTITGAVIPTPKYDSPEAVANSAVNNSLALEFDTQRNDVTNSVSDAPIAYEQYRTGALGFTLNQDYSLNGYDTKDINVPIPAGFPKDTALGASTNGYGHISFTYPGDPDSYKLINALASVPNASKYYKQFKQSYSLFHIGNRIADLTNGKDAHGQTVYWHHLTFKWSPPASGSTVGTATYYFNDKELDGTINSTGTESKGDSSFTYSTPVDESIFHLKSGQHNILWGFTGANSSQVGVASKLVDFESIPALLTAETSSSITDNTLQKTIPNDQQDLNVSGGDQVDLNYRLTYDTGNVDWSNIEAKINLPKHFTVTKDASDNIGSIIYSDGTIENITIKELNNNLITHMLGENLSASNPEAQVIITGKVDNTTGSTVVVDKAPAIFQGTNEISSTNTPIFNIQYLPYWSLHMQQPTTDIDLLYKQDNAALDLPISLNYSDDHNFQNNDELEYDFTVNNHQFTTTVPTNSDSATATNIVDLKKIIDNSGTDFWSLFPENTTQKVTVTVTDKDGITSNSEIYNINVLQNHTLEINASKELNFKDVNFISAQEYLKRIGLFSLSVTSYKDPWELSASINGLYHDKTAFDGTLVFKENNNDIKDLNNNPVIIAKDLISHDPSETENISQNWTADTGILLKQTGQNIAGHYQGTIYWTASDILNN